MRIVTFTLRGLAFIAALIGVGAFLASLLLRATAGNLEGEQQGGDNA